jgi:hypothetical protein
MLNVSQDIQNATVASSRCPSARVLTCWDRTQVTTDWFRLDQSELDSASVLTLVPYLNGEVVNEIITDIDNFKYTEETDYIIDAEGLAEMRGDNYQSVMSESDISLENTTDRFTPQDNKNLLSNPDFESNYDNWSIASGASGGWALVGGSDVVSGAQAMKILNPSSEDVYLHSDQYNVSSGINYTGSIFAKGLGTLSLKVVGVGSGTTVVGSGTLTTAIASGSFGHYGVTYQLPTNATQAYLRVGTSSGAIIVDGAQLEQADEFTSYDANFIGDKILPKRPVKIQINMFDKPNGTGGSVPAFAGLTENIEPQIKNDVVNLHCYDYATELEDIVAQTSASGMGIYTNIYSHDLIKQLGYKGGLVDENMTVESGRQQIPFAWFKDGSVWYYMQQIAEAEGGRVFFDEEGQLQFWNRDHFDNNITSRFTFNLSNDVEDLSYRVDKDEIKNDIIVKSVVREAQSDQEVWKSTTATEILAGESITIWANINDQEGRDMPCTTITEPTATGDTSYYYANTEEDNTGTERSTDISCSFYSFGTSAKMTFTNNADITLYITEIVLFGTPIKIIREIEVEKEDSASIAIYGRQTLQLENNLIASENYAANLAASKLFDLKNPLNNIHLSVVGVPYLQVGDVVTVPTGYNKPTKNLFITRNRWQLLKDGDYMQNLDLLQKTIAVFFTLDQSTLDSSDVLQI